MDDKQLQILVEQFNEAVQVRIEADRKRQLTQLDYMVAMAGTIEAVGIPHKVTRAPERKPHPLGDAAWMRIEFDNGYGASIINGWGSGGDRPGHFELGVMQGDFLCYNTPVTDDVLGYLDASEVVAAVLQISLLPPLSLPAKTNREMINEGVEQILSMMEEMGNG